MCLKGYTQQQNNSQQAEGRHVVANGDKVGQ